MLGLKAGDIGLMIFGLAQMIFMVFPFLDKDPEVLPAHKRPRFFIWFWVMLVTLVILSVYGKLPPTGANAWVGFYATAMFLLLWVVLPIVTKIDAKKRGAL
jgi:ubiquinol-cytochrome c reductase cytochrome b subunit